MCQTSAPLLRGQWGVKCFSESGNDDLQRRNSKEGRERSTGSTDMRYAVFFLFFFVCLHNLSKPFRSKQTETPVFNRTWICSTPEFGWPTFTPLLMKREIRNCTTDWHVFSWALQSNSVNSLSPTPSAWEDRKPIWIVAPKARVSTLLNYLHTLSV